MHFMKDRIMTTARYYGPERGQIIHSAVCIFHCERRQTGFYNISDINSFSNVYMV